MNKMKKEFFDREKNALMEGFYARYMRKNSQAYTVALIMVIIFECYMIARGLIMFDFTIPRYKGYFISYVFLLLATVLGLLCIRKNRKGTISPNGITLALHLYCIFIIGWSLVISYFDMSVGSEPLVFLTVIMAVGGLSLVNPLFYAFCLILSMTALGFFHLYADLAFIQSGRRGSYLNIMVFVLVTLLLAFRQYSISRREAELSDHLAELSFKDHLTGLSNRRMYDETCQRIETADEETLVGMLDLDAFKRLNDTYGHDFGDECLTLVGMLLYEVFGERSFRVGGDEFAVLIERLAPEEIDQKLAFINRTLSEAFPDKGVSMSGGFFLRERGSGMPMDDADDRADEALYEAKNGGKHKACFADAAAEET